MHWEDWWVSDGRARMRVLTVNASVLHGDVIMNNLLHERVSDECFVVYVVCACALSVCVTNLTSCV